MSRPVLIAVVVHLAVGLAFALAARDRVRADGPSSSPSLFLVLMHAGGVIAPIALYFYAAHPAWTWLYLVDPGGVPGLALLPLVVGHAGIVVAAYYGGALLLRAERRREVVWTIAGLGALAVLLAALLRGRLGVSTSYAGFHGGRGRELMEVELGWALLVALLATGGSIAYVIFELSRDARRVRSR
jgi:hypothetical protein